MTAPLTAYVTTSDSMPSVEAGITVFNSGLDPDTGQWIDGDAVAINVRDYGYELDSEALSAGGTHLLDDAAADALLERMGYVRQGPWVESGGQWATTVVHTLRQG